MDESETPLCRRNSIATTVIIPSKITAAVMTSSSAPSIDLELIPLKQSSLVAYSSLKDLLPSPIAVNSPSAAGEISIRNRLVKQAAWAYLQPATPSSSPGRSSGSQFLRCIWLPLSVGLRFITRVIDWMFRFIRMPI